MRLLLYLGMLALGAYIGFKEMAHPKLLKGLDKFQFAALIALLFIMGVRIGADKEVMESIDTIGIKGLIFAITTVSFSVFFVWCYKRLFHKKEAK